ncbi:MAG: DUF3303 family protein [Candidatus Bathyarchaeia archaeon]
MRWKEENMRELTKRTRKFTLSAGDYKILFPPHTTLGANKTSLIVETDDIEVSAQLIQPRKDIATYEISPIMDPRKLMALFGVSAPPILQ